jgi:hypothetical protein
MKKCLPSFLCFLMIYFSFYAKSQSIFQSWYDASVNYSFGKSICQLANGDFILTGFTNASAPGYEGFHLVKISSTGNYLWEKIIGSAKAEWAESVALTNDGGFVIAGFGDANVSGTDQDIYIVKTDGAGNIAWQKQISYNINYDYAHSIIQAGDGSYVTCGYATRTSTYTAPAVNIIKLSATGATAGAGTWNVNFGDGEGGEAFCVIASTDGNYVITGNYFTAADGAQIFLLKLNGANGNVIWSKTYGGNMADIGYNVKQTADGGYIITGTTSSYGAGDFDCFLLKTDASGNEQWFKTFGNIYWDEGHGVVQTTDAGYVMGGFISQTWADRDFYIIKTDDSGNLLWDKAYGGSDWEECSTMILCNDGGFALTGRTFSFGSGFGYNAYMVKTDAQGNADCHLKPFSTLANSYSLPGTGVMFLLSSSLTSSNSNFTVTPFSNSGIICNSTPLPVELVSFTGIAQNNQNILSWTTAGEINNDYFTVLKSSDGNNFEAVVKINGAGNSSQTIHYSFPDLHPFTGINYYRLQQTDYNGHLSYSKTISIQNRGSEVTTMSLSFNRAAGYIEIIFSQTEKYFETVLLTAAGETACKTQNQSKIDIAYLPAGMYFIKVIAQDNSFTQKFIKQ